MTSTLTVHAEALDPFRPLTNEDSNKHVFVPTEPSLSRAAVAAQYPWTVQHLANRKFVYARVMADPKGVEIVVESGQSLGAKYLLLRCASASREVREYPIIVVPVQALPQRPRLGS